jgi:hypothetical protein
VVSLCRYAWAVNRLRNRDLKQVISQPIAADTALVLGRRVELLADTHLPTALAAMLSNDAAGLPDHALAGPRVFLLVKRDGPGEDVATYRIGPDTFALLERWRQPKSYVDLCAELAHKGDSPIPDLADVRDLCARGILDVADRPRLARAAE